MQLPICPPSGVASLQSHCRRLSALTLATFSLLAGTGRLHADDISWNAATDGLWSDASNWSSDPVLPGVEDTVTIAATTGGTDPYTVTFGTGTEADATLTADVFKLTLGVAGAPRATLHLKGGTLTADVGEAPASGNSTPPLTMTNADLVVDTGATLLLRSGPGGGGNGFRGLVMTGNATATINGTVKVQPSGGATGSVGGGLHMSGSAGQTNTVTIGRNAVAEFGYTYVGPGGQSAQNHVIVDGGSLKVRAFELGRGGTDNTISVKNGGTFTEGGGGASIGGASNNTGTGHLIIGEIDEGGAILSEGTVTMTSGLTVGAGTASGNGTVTLNAGSFSMTTSAARTVTLASGPKTTGTLNIKGGTMNITRSQGDHTLRLAPGYVDETSTGTATINLSGGALNVDKFVSQTVAGTINFTGGLFTVKQATVSNGKAFTVGNGTDAATFRLVTATGSGDHTFADGLVISGNARLEGSGRIGTGLASVSGTLAASGTLEFADGLTLFDGSTIDLNNSSGSLFISGGDLTIADGATINIRLTDFTDGNPVTLFTASDSIAGTALDNVNFLFNGVATTGSWSGADFLITAVAVPEPSTVALVLGGLTLLASLGVRRQR
ncbi:anchor protein [Opitutaceae bacterium TAV5]|nr:anchor protein [Opitutaceae bacterium TAV5]